MYYLTKTNKGWDDLSKEILSNLPSGNYTIQKKLNKRSTEQNSAYWLLRVQPIASWLREQGNQVSEDDVHYWLKVKFLGYKILTINGKESKVLKSTTELSKIDFMAYMEDISVYFAQRGLILKDPNQQEFLEGE